MPSRRVYEVFVRVAVEYVMYEPSSENSAPCGVACGENLPHRRRRRRDTRAVTCSVGDVADAVPGEEVVARVLHDDRRRGQCEERSACLGRPSFGT